MENEILFRKQMVEKYRPTVEKMIRYLPWLDSKNGAKVSSLYTGDGIEGHSIPVPVYDSTLLAMVKEFQSMEGLMNYNYRYVYSRNSIRTIADEKRFIEKADISQMEDLKGILSKYVIEGMRKGIVWNTAVENGIFYDVISKMKELLEFWDKPM